jgi:hypothetical protein
MSFEANYDCGAPMDRGRPSDRPSPHDAPSVPRRNRAVPASPERRVPARGALCHCHIRTEAPASVAASSSPSVAPVGVYPGQAGDRRDEAFRDGAGLRPALQLPQVSNSFHTSAGETPALPSGAK